MSSSCPPPSDSAGCTGRLGVGEAVVAVTPVVCVTALAALERPLPGVLVAFAAAAGALLMPGRLGCLLGAGAGSSR
ncbi:hypothetical protein [Streptomyces cathayae]|uniref:Uncharacterized protein n=1 Tax=Streptomyces cathayae TaxID=3031124 RepID=A0ABY8KB98_9ACTN|nr:hypothetical protein [Streptomyces sp. HUAS 5]WGD45132.1 hypothetical protein PYS65_34125 [Streptomyces sp. HUAS 5]